MKPPSQAFRSKYVSKCSNLNCVYDGRKIEIGQLIRWSRGEKPSRVWHDGPCYETRLDPGNFTVPDASANTSNNSNTSSTYTPTKCSECSECGCWSDASMAHFSHCSQRIDQDVRSNQDTVKPMPTPTLKPTSPAITGSSSDFLAGMASALAPYLDQQLNSKLDADQVRDIVQDLLGSAILKTVTTVEIMDYKSNEVKDLGLQHKDFPELLQCCNARTESGHRLNIWLAGPAGTGKTTAAEFCARALALTFYFTGSIDTEYKLMGFIDAQGRIVNTQFRQAYEFGGVFLFDECDSSLPGALLAFNAALANGHAAFPDGVVKRHPDFCCIAAANTWGLGANSDYVGRLKLDAAFLDRFVTMSWGIDEALELATAGNPAWVKRVQSLRKAALSKGVKTIISPRASYYGASLLKTGMAQDRVEALTVRKAMDDTQWSNVVGSAAIQGSK